MRALRKTLFAGFAGIVLLLGAGGAVADQIIYTLVAANTAAIGPGPYGTVSVTTDGTNIANVLFSANTGGGYAFVNGSAADVNVNGGTLTAGSLSGTDSPLSPGASTVNLSSSGSGNVDGFGVFNVRISNQGGWGDALATIAFTLTKTVGTWGSAASVLLASSPVAAHVGWCPPPATSCTGTVATGFATVPIPAAAWLFGSGLLGLIAIARRRSRASGSPALA